MSNSWYRPCRPKRTRTHPSLQAEVSHPHLHSTQPQIRKQHRCSHQRPLLPPFPSARLRLPAPDQALQQIYMTDHTPKMRKR